MNFELQWAPLVPWQVVAPLAAAGVLLLAFAAFRRSRGTLWRLLALTVIVLALLNPRAVREERQAQPDVAVVVVDQSASQKIGDRQAQTEKALEQVQASLARFKDLRVRVVRAGDAGIAAGDGGTRLFKALDQAMGDVPVGSFAGAVMITDGEVHDVPAAGKAAADGEPSAAQIPGPVHVLLTGRHDERDRRITITKAPGYGIVGSKVTVNFRVDETPASAAGHPPVEVTLRRGTNPPQTLTVPVGVDTPVTFPLDHAGQTVVELTVAAAPNELSTLNNRTAVSINGVRDRLRVLLVSGQPHSGERTWRNLLKSDPSVDLIHFTILRSPEKDDFTPINELSLIVFPVRELFQVKLKDFDLVVFDRYVIRDVLPPTYLHNIEEYVRDGGALMLAVGPEFAGPRSLFRTALGNVIPAEPTSKVIDGGFRPQLTPDGMRHPVTAGLPGGGKDPKWGRWFRIVQGVANHGEVLMQGPDSTPLLVLDRVGKGRVGELMSDHIWLWARGFEGGGPQGELLRRVAHWLMKEPELEEERLSASAKGDRLVIERHSLSAEPREVTVTSPSGTVSRVKLNYVGDGLSRGSVPVEELGLYRIEDDKLKALAAVGTLNPLELRDLRATADILAPVVKATGGGIAWIADGAVPDFRRTKPGRDMAGRGWFGLRRNGAYLVTGVKQVPLLPGLLVLTLVLGGLIIAWRREGR